MSTFRSWYIYMCLSAVKSLVIFQMNTYCTEENYVYLIIHIIFRKIMPKCEYQMSVISGL